MPVKFAPLIAGNVPVMFAAGKLVKFAPLIAGRVPVKFAAGNEVKFAPLPLNVVAVTIPVTSIPCEFEVTAEPTTIEFAVAVLATKLPVRVVALPT